MEVVFQPRFLQALHVVHEESRTEHRHSSSISFSVLQREDVEHPGDLQGRRGPWHRRGGFPLSCSVHPAYMHGHGFSDGSGSALPVPLSLILILASAGEGWTDDGFCEGHCLQGLPVCPGEHGESFGLLPAGRSALPSPLLMFHPEKKPISLSLSLCNTFLNLGQCRLGRK